MRNGSRALSPSDGYSMLLRHVSIRLTRAGELRLIWIVVKYVTCSVSEAGSFYSNIYTGQRPASQRVTRPAPPPPSQSSPGAPAPGPAAPPATWQCHLCTFRNHPLLDKCEECDMPRIIVGEYPRYRTNDSGFESLSTAERLQTSALMPGDVPERPQRHLDLSVQWSSFGMPWQCLNCANLTVLLCDFSVFKRQIIYCPNYLL